MNTLIDILRNRDPELSYGRMYLYGLVRGTASCWVLRHVPHTKVAGWGISREGENLYASL